MRSRRSFPLAKKTFDIVTRQGDHAYAACGPASRMTVDSMANRAPGHDFPFPERADGVLTSTGFRI